MRAHGRKIGHGQVMYIGVVGAARLAVKRTTKRVLRRACPSFMLPRPHIFSRSSTLTIAAATPLRKMATSAPAGQQPPFELRWLVRVPDHNTAESREKRASLMAQHKGRLMVFKKESPGTIRECTIRAGFDVMRQSNPFFLCATPRRVWRTNT